MTKTSGSLSISAQRKLVIGITFSVGLTLGVLAVIVIQTLGPLSDQAVDDDMHSDAHQFLTKNEGSEAISNLK